jgi:pullulanase
MILAGDEFADDNDRVIRHPDKQSDPVNYDRLNDGWRQEVFRYVARLVQFRTQSEALSVNETELIHADVQADRRVLAWRRGRPGVEDPVVVVANFSDFESFEYRVPNWPDLPGRQWRDVSQGRDVDPAWVGREGLYRWEAKVYAPV